MANKMGGTQLCIQVWEEKEEEREMPSEGCCRGRNHADHGARRWQEGCSGRKTLLLLSTGLLCTQLSDPPLELPHGPRDMERMEKWKWA